MKFVTKYEPSWPVRPGSKPKIIPGLRFGVPLEGGGWGLATMIRVHPNKYVREPICLCCGFDKVLDREPLDTDFAGLSMLDVVCFSYCSTRLVFENRWPSYGVAADWSMNDWPIPPMSNMGNVPKAEMPNDVRDWMIDVLPDDARNGSALLANEYLTKAEFAYLPHILGLASPNMLSTAIDQAIRHNNPMYRCRVTPKHLKIWQKCLDGIKADGKLPQKKPKR